MSRFAAAFVLCLCLVGVSVSQEMDIQDWLDDASWRESEDPSDGEPDGFSKLPGPKANGAGGRRPATPGKNAVKGEEMTSFEKVMQDGANLCGFVLGMLTLLTVFLSVVAKLLGYCPCCPQKPQLPAAEPVAGTPGAASMASSAAPPALPPRDYPRSSAIATAPPLPSLYEMQPDNSTWV